MNEQHSATRSAVAAERQTDVAVLAGGCFWGVEEILREVPGVIGTDVGCTGGRLVDATYQDTHDSKSGHAEAIRVTFDPSVLSYEDVLERWFFRLHDPTTLNRQGNDVGTQYRSAIFPQTPEQQRTAEQVRTRVEASGRWKQPITTTIESASVWYSAEEYHQDYLRLAPVELCNKRAHMARHHHSIADEATSAGLLGASVVAAWFLLLDFMAGRPLHIASVLGQVLLLGDRTPDLIQLHAGAVELYGFFHFLSFLAVGWLAVRLLHMAVREPVWLVGLLLVFVSLETVVFAVSFPLFEDTGAESLRGPVLIGNGLAVLAMGTYLWRTHRLLVRYVARVPLGDTGDEPEVKTAEAWYAMARWRAR
jgi:peptide-methionine (S)-S-oxide reductase